MLAVPCLADILFAQPQTGEIANLRNALLILRKLVDEYSEYLNY